MTDEIVDAVARALGDAPAGTVAELGNGERWRRDGYRWHMLGGADYDPLPAPHFPGYAACCGGVVLLEHGASALSLRLG